MVAERLTKKQKKASAFRDRKGKKGGEDETLDVPQTDKHDVPAVAIDDSYAPVEEPVVKKRAEKKEKEEKKKKKVEEKTEVVAPAKVANKKRKRDEGVAATEQAGTEPSGTTGAVAAVGDGSKKKKRRKVAEGENGGEAGKGEDEGEDKNRRLILFLGNLKYTTSRETIAAHFAACDPPPSIRLLTPKAARPGATVTKSKGCAFLEFKTKSALQQALKLHNSDLDGRKVNVELTAGGGGKSDARLEKLKKRNTELNTQRKKKVEKGDANAVDPRTQRFSTTSGEGEAPSGRRTWTVGDVQEEETHRGGKNAKKRGAKKGGKPREWGTGMNAIPVG